MSPAPAAARSARLFEQKRIEQRSHRRYPVTLDVEYKVWHKGKLERTGTGRTRNVSTGGVLIETKDPPRSGDEIELWINWPFLLEGVCRLNLVLVGNVVRSGAGEVAVKTRHHEFRTAGAAKTKGRATVEPVRSWMK
jgi:hypothetical protein